MSSHMLVLPFLRYPFDKIILYNGLAYWSYALKPLKVALHSYCCQEIQCIIDTHAKFLSSSGPTFENSRNKIVLHSLMCLKCWNYSTFFIKIRKLFHFFYSVAHVVIYTTKNSYLDSVGSGSFIKKLLLLLLFGGSFLWPFYCKQVFVRMGNGSKFGEKPYALNLYIFIVC